MTLLQTSPLLFLRPDGRSSIAGHQLEGRLSLTEIEMLSFFAEPKTPDLAARAKFDDELIARAVTQGLLVECNKDGQSDCSLWETYNQQRAAFYMFSSFEDREPDVSFVEHLKHSNNNFAESFHKLFNRRTERFFTDESVSQETLEAVAADVNNAIGDNRWLSFRILVQGVEGLKPGIYSHERKSGQFIQQVDSYTRKDLLECLHGQWWLNGGGVCWFFVVSLAELAKLHRNIGITGGDSTSPRNYFEMMVLLGAAGQALVNSAYNYGLGCWMTPALSETQSAKILGLNKSADDSEEALYFFKVGIPERVQAARQEKRSPI